VLLASSTTTGEHLYVGMSRPELRRLQQIHSALPTMRNTLAVNQQKVAGLDSTIARIRCSLADDEAHLETLTRRRRFRRPDHDAIDTTQCRIDTQPRTLISRSPATGRLGSPPPTSGRL
jgi:hypothetical protein